jgi:hypothetical protein
LAGGDWAKSKGEMRASIRQATRQREVEERVLLGEMISLSLIKATLCCTLHCTAARAGVE